LKVIRHIRPKLSCRSCEQIVQAPTPDLPIEKGRPGPGLVASVVVGKYLDGLPLYRQSTILAREGVAIERATLADWVGHVAWWLRPLAEVIGAQVMAAPILHTDDTPIAVLAPGNGRTRTGRLWAYVVDERPWQGGRPPTAYYRFSPDRRGERPRDHLARFRGTIQADAFSGYEALARSAAERAAKGPGRGPPALTHAACWAHARRKFYDVFEATRSPIAEESLQRIDLPSKKWTGLGRQSLGMSWAEITQGRVQAAGIVEAFDVLKQITSGVGSSGVNPMVDALGFEGVKETLHRGVVEAIALAAHRRRDAGSGKNPSISFGSILNAAVGVVDQPWRRPLPLDGHGEGLQGNLGVQGLAHRPTNDFAGMQVQNGGEVQPAFAGRDVGQIRQPDLAGACGDKIASQSIGRDRVIVPAVSGSSAPRQGGKATKPGTAHQPLDPAAANAAAAVTQRGMDPRRAVGPAAFGMHPADLLQQHPVVAGTPAFRP